MRGWVLDDLHASGLHTEIIQIEALNEVDCTIDSAAASAKLLAGAEAAALAAIHASAADDGSKRVSDKSGRSALVEVSLRWPLLLLGFGVLSFAAVVTAFSAGSAVLLALNGADAAVSRYGTMVPLPIPMPLPMTGVEAGAGGDVAAALLHSSASWEGAVVTDSDLQLPLLAFSELMGQDADAQSPTDLAYAAKLAYETRSLLLSLATLLVAAAVLQMEQHECVGQPAIRTQRCAVAVGAGTAALTLSYTVLMPGGADVARSAHTAAFAVMVRGDRALRCTPHRFGVSHACLVSAAGVERAALFCAAGGGGGRERERRRGGQRVRVAG